jgi:hypothetical protein
MCFPSRPLIEATKFLADSGVPFGNEKTAEFEAMLDELMEASLDKAENGQKLQLPILKILTKSPCCFFIAFGKRMLMIAEPESVKWIRSQVRVSGEPVFSPGRISLSRKDPKKQYSKLPIQLFCFPQSIHFLQFCDPKF